MVEVVLETQQVPACPKCGSNQQVVSHGKNRWKCKSCRYNFRTSSFKMKKCPTCGQEFKVISTENKNQIYCSIPCRPSFRLKETRVYTPYISRLRPKPCPVCETQFTSAEDYCSVKCRMRARELREAQKKKELKPNSPQVACLWCKDWFKQKHPKHLFDISECNLSFRGMERNIRKQFENDLNRQQLELAKLKQLGKGYVLPEREIA